MWNKIACYYAKAAGGRHVDVKMRCYFLQGNFVRVHAGLYYKGERAPAVKGRFSTRGILLGFNGVWAISRMEPPQYSRLDSPTENY